MNRNEVNVTSPCTLDWKNMTPAEGGRFCGDCKKVVKNFSTMTEKEARALLKNAGNGELCVRFAYDEHGRIFFGKDAPKKDPLVPASLLVRARRVAAAAAIGALPFATQACEAVTAPLGITEREPNLPPEHHELMGGATPGDHYPTPPTDAIDAGDAGDGGDGGDGSDERGDAAPDEQDAGPDVHIYN